MAAVVGNRDCLVRLQVEVLWECIYYKLTVTPHERWRIRVHCQGGLSERIESKVYRDFVTAAVAQPP